MFQEMCGLVSQIASVIGWNETAEDTDNAAIAHIETDQKTKAENDASSKFSEEVEEVASEPDRIEGSDDRDTEAINSTDAAFEAAALQVPAVTTSDDGGNVPQVSTPPTESSASTPPPSAQELRRGESLPQPLPPSAREATKISMRSNLGNQSSHSAYHGRSTSFTPPSSSHHHRRSSSTTEVSYAMMSFATADQLHASWTNASSDPDDPLSFLSPAGFTSAADASLGSSRPLPVSRISSNASSAASVPVLVSSSSFIGEDHFYNGISSAIHDAARITDWETVKALCAQDPEAAKFAGKDRWTALHHACNRRCPDLEVFKALLHAYPDALLVEEDKGWCPLHYACRFKAPKEAVRLLVHMFPEKGKCTVKKADRQGRTPLYYAVRYDAPPGVVEILLNVDASAVLEKDQNGDSPLSLVWDSWAEKLEGKRTLQRIMGAEADNESPEERAVRVQKRLNSQSKVLARWNTVNKFLKASFGFPVADPDDSVDDNSCHDQEEKKDAPSTSPDGAGFRKWRILHATAAIKCHPSLFQLACILHPEQVDEVDEGDLRGPSNVQGGWQTARNLSALHLAASSQASGDAGKAVLQKLLVMNPAAAMRKDSLGSLPLHRIVENKEKAHWTHDGAKEIYDSYMDAVRIPDLDGRLPLHRSATAMIPQGEATAETTALRSTLCSLLELHPDGASHSDTFGCLPLHMAAEHGTAWDIQLQLLHDQFPQAVRSRTGVKLGNLLPLHMAASNPSAEPSLIKTLLDLHPRAASQSNRGGKLPLHLACETGLSWESVHAIHEANPNAVRQIEQNARGWNALQMASASKRSGEALLSNLLQLYSEAAAVADTRGRYALHLAIISGKGWNQGLSALFDVYPEAISTADTMGLLPFYIACFRYCEAPKDPEKLFVSAENLHCSSDTPNKHHRRHSSRVSIESIQREQAMEAESARQTDILFNLLKADPTVLP